MTSFTESTIEQAAFDWQEETLKVFTANLRLIGREGLAYHGAYQPRKPLGSPQRL